MSANPEASPGRKVIAAVTASMDGLTAAPGGDVAKDPDSARRDRDLATWLDEVDKVVVSRKLERADWSNSRIARDPEVAINDLKREPGRDILVLNSASIIQALLRTDLVDELRLNVIPKVLGRGLRLYDDVPPSEWSLAGATAFSTTGTLALHYRRP